jgi:hypothetical protein
MGHSNNSFFGRAALAVATLAGLLLFAGAPNLRADDDGGMNTSIAGVLTTIGMTTTMITTAITTD